jgi:hypothetical protein
MNRKRLIGCGAASVLGFGLFVGVGVAFVGGIFALTRPVVDASEQFLALLGREKFAEAYASAADGFRARQGEREFAAAVKQLGLTDYSSATWHSRQIDNQDGVAEGTVVTKEGGTKAVSVRLVREGGKWAVVAVRYGGIDLATIKPAPAPPPEAELEMMTSEALLEFNRAVRAKDFAAFYGTLSDLWKKQTTPERLRRAFQVFIDKEVDVAAINQSKPHFSRAEVNDTGLLVVAGEYPTQPSRVVFELEYARESSWKLAGLSVSVRPEASRGAN